jgi:hypothetical protein
LAAISALVLAATVAAAQGDGFTKKFPLASCQFISIGGNGYFSLIPGRQLYYSNAACVAAGKCDELEELWITVERETKRISLPIGGKTRTFVARVVEERETEDGELVEISRNYFANCWPSRDVYYFGEDVDIYAAGRIVSHEGAWHAGTNGARFGLMMPGSPVMGQRFYQEFAPKVAMDRAEVVGLSGNLKTPAGNFNQVLKIIETTPLDRGSEAKYYASGVGLLQDGSLKLVKYGKT